MTHLQRLAAVNRAIAGGHVMPRSRGFSANAAPRPVGNATTTNTGNYFEALRDSQDRTPIPAFQLQIRNQLRSLNRDRLAAIGRYLDDNFGIVSFAINQVANYSVPIIPAPISPNPAWNKQAIVWWNNWCKIADFYGRFDFETLQRIACRAIEVEGDSGFAVVGDNGYPQVQMFPGWQIGARTVPLLVGKDTVFDGIRVDPNGRIVGIYVETPQGPQPQDPSQFYLLFDAERAENYRGLTPLRRGSNDLRDAKDIKAFEKLAVKIQSSLALAMKGDSADPDEWNDQSDPNNAQPADATNQERMFTVAEMLGGDILQLPDGREIQNLSQTRPGASVIEFLAVLGAEFVQGMGLPPSFIIDDRFTGPNQRSINGKAQRTFNNRQRIFGSFVEWLWPRVVGWAIDHGELPAQEGFDRIEWTGPAKITIDAGREMAQEREDIGTALMSRREHYGNRNLDWRQETDQIMEEDAYIMDGLKKLSATSGVDIKILMTKWGWEQPKVTAPNPAGGNDAGIA